MNVFDKIKFILKKPKVILVTGKGSTCAREAIFRVLNQYPQIVKEVLFLESDLKDSREITKFRFLINNSSLFVLTVTHIEDIYPDKNFFSGNREKTEIIRQLAKIMPVQSWLVLNFDDETVREIADITNLNTLTFGFQEGADFYASDIILNGGTNFKINYKGNMVPVWLNGLFGKEQIYSALAAVCLGTIFKLNLIEISQALKNYQSLPGKMRLIEGTKNSIILDNSESASVFSMLEAIEILGKIQGFKRRVAVLGDVVGVGYKTEDYESIGEKIVQNADLLFVFGPRAKFIADDAKIKGMAADKIFHFATIDDGKLKIKEEIKEKDLILVDGSKETRMDKIVDEIKKGNNKNKKEN